MKRSIRNRCRPAAIARCRWRALLAVISLRMLQRPARSAASQVWDDMKHQPKFKAQRRWKNRTFSPISRDSRCRPEDTVARGNLREDTPFNTGMENGHVRRQEPGAAHPGSAEARARRNSTPIARRATIKPAWGRASCRPTCLPGSPRI